MAGATELTATSIPSPPAGDSVEGTSKLGRIADWPVYPLLFAAFPILAVYSANSALFPLESLWRPLAISVGVMAFVFLIASWLWRSPARGATAALAVGLWLAAGAAITSGMAVWIPGDYVPWVYGGLALLGLAVPRWLVLPVRPINALSLCVVAVSVASVAQPLVRPTARTTAAHLAPLPSPERPDVYYFILDGLGSEASVREHLGVDIAWLTKGLEERGFRSAPNATANYVQTLLSVASSLNADYLPALLPKAIANSEDRAVLSPLLADSWVAARFRASGYRIVGYGTGYDGLSLGREQMPELVDSAVTMLEATLLEFTVFRDPGFVHAPRHERHRQQLRRVFAEIQSAAKRTSRPRFTIVHVLGPHPPFSVEANGDPRPKAGIFGFWDGSDYLTHVGTTSDYRAGYDAKVRYVGQQLLATIDALIRANPAQPPVIIVQGDHGSKLKLDQNSLERTNLNEALSITNAIYAPSFPNLEWPADATPVNTFRRLLRAWGEKLPDHPERNYYSTFPRPFAFTDVTDQVRPSNPSR